MAPSLFLGASLGQCVYLSALSSRFLSPSTNLNSVYMLAASAAVFGSFFK